LSFEYEKYLMAARRPKPSKIVVRKAEEKDRKTLFKWMGDAHKEKKGNWSINPKSERTLPLSEMSVAADERGKLLGTVIVDRTATEMIYSENGRDGTAHGRMLHGGYVPREHRGSGADRELVSHITREADGKRHTLIAIPISKLAENNIKKQGFAKLGRTVGKRLYLSEEMIIEQKVMEGDDYPLYRRESK
jgi:GNAT superfamily N-acetyltransferase